jgi:hypothetical protein
MPATRLVCRSVLCFGVESSKHEGFYGRCEGNTRTANQDGVPLPKWGAYWFLGSPRFLTVPLPLKRRGRFFLGCY